MKKQLLLDPRLEIKLELSKEAIFEGSVDLMKVENVPENLKVKAEIEWNNNKTFKLIQDI
jgi:hypothetical protein